MRNIYAQQDVNEDPEMRTLEEVIVTNKLESDDNYGSLTLGVGDGIYFHAIDILTPLS